MLTRGCARTVFGAVFAVFRAGTGNAPSVPPPSQRRKCGRFETITTRGDFMRTQTRFGLVVLGLAVVTMLTGGASHARAGLISGGGDPFIFNFDENGNGSYQQY